MTLRDIGKEKLDCTDYALNKGDFCPTVLGCEDDCKDGSGDCVACWNKEYIQGTNNTEDPIKPSYYNDTKITPFDVIDDWNLNYYLGNAIKYIKRAGKKDGNSRLQDLKKIREYIEHEIQKEEV